MDQTPVVTLAAGTIGAAIGLLAPFIATALTQRGVTRESQRIVANEILDLLSEPIPIDELLGGRHSSARRRLYILGIRLRDRSAREACEQLVIAAGEAIDEDGLYPAWSRTIQEVSRISRH